METRIRTLHEEKVLGRGRTSLEFFGGVIKCVFGY